jgi:hypothetical protein
LALTLVRTKLYSEAWDESDLHEGAWRSGMIPFACDDVGVTEGLHCRVILRTNSTRPIAELEFKGFLLDGAREDVPGSANGTMTYRHVARQSPAVRRP